MGFVMPNKMVLLGGAVLGVALLLQIVGLATTGWVVVSASFGGLSVDVQSGLWRSCSNGICTDYTTSTASLDAVRAFGILGVLGMAAAMLCVLLMCVMSEQKIFSLLAPVCAAGAAFCAMIEFAVFAGENSAASDNFNYSFGLTVVACVLSLAAAILFFLGRNRAS